MVKMISILVAVVSLLAVLIMYLLFCKELRVCLQYLGLDDRLAFVPIYNMWLYLQLGDDYEDGSLIVKDGVTVPRVFVFAVYSFFVFILVLMSVVNLQIDPFIITIMSLIFAMNLSVAGTSYGVYFYEGFRFDERTLAVIGSALLGALPCICLGRYFILRHFREVCEHELDNSQGDE